jgi:drug/metabolite transporter (DMT)-like permease
MTEPSPAAAREVDAQPIANPQLAAVLAWLLPGAGHIYLRRRSRGAAYLLLVAASLVIGCSLHGRLWTPAPGEPLSVLATLGSMGMGLAYFVLRYALHYGGDILSPGFEYGSAYVLTAGLMNLLLVLDAWDIARGKKE